MSDTTYHSGSIVQVSSDGYGVYEVTQIEQAHGIPLTVQGVEDDRVDIDWSFGPLKVQGYVIKSTFEFATRNSLVGISAPVVYGNLKDGVVIKYNLDSAKGENKFYLKNGNEVWTHLDIKIRFNGSFDKDVKLVTI